MSENWLCNTWYSGLCFKKIVGNIFIICTAWLIARAQKIWGRFIWYRMARVMLMMCWCFLSTMPFCWGVPTYEVWWMMPDFWKKGFKHKLIPLYNLMHFTFVLNWVWTIDTKDSMRGDVSYYSLIRNIQVNLLLSSKTVKKYLKPIMDGVDRELQMSMWIKSKLWRETWLLLWKGNLFFLA